LFECKIQLAMSAAAVASTAVVSATAATVEPTATAAMETIATAEAFTAMEAVVAAAETFMAVESATSIVTATVIAATTVESAAVVAAVEPGTGADEDATGEVVRPVVAVRSASVRIVAVVTVSADRRGADGAVHGAYTDAHAELRLGGACGKKKNSS
jgi:hypothetical protein